MTGQPHPLILRAARAAMQPAVSPINVSCTLPSVLRRRQFWICSLSCLSPLPMPTQLLLLSFFTERIDANYFKAPLTTSKSRQTTSEDAWALFVRLCRYADNEYSNHFNISFAIVDIKCVQNYNKLEVKGVSSALDT